MKQPNKNIWFGTDASLEISLCEYGILCRKIDSDEYECIIKYNKDQYKIASFTNSEVNDFLKESWIDKEDFLSFLGMQENAWFEMPIVHKLTDLIQYHGYLNIVESTPMHFNTLAEINAKFDFNFED